jgi:O-antigen ligase
LAAITLVILSFALFLSYARGAWLALFTGIAAVWLIRKRTLVVTYCAVILLMLAALLWLRSNDRYLQYAHDYRTTIWHENFQEHLSATYEFKDASTAERFYRWIAGVRMVKDNWLTGYGPNSFYYNYKPYAVPAFRTWVSDNPEHSTVHNYFLLMTIEQGLPGLLFFLLLTGAMLYYAQHLYHRVSDIFYKRVALLCGVITIMILTVNFLSDLIETDKIGSLFFLCLSLLIITDRNTGSDYQSNIQSR